MKTFQVPPAYRSPLITAIKNKRRADDKMKKDFTPTLLDFGPLQIYVARHFGFCYGVENAIDIAFRIISENPGRRIFLLSEMIHNPQVNRDLLERGIQFLQDTNGRQLISFDELNAADIVITPAFGTSLEIEKILQSKGIQTERYNTTCPFVEKVWNRSEQISVKNFTVIIHGKPGHEETRATFSHAAASGPAIIIANMQEAEDLAGFIREQKPSAAFFEIFRDRISNEFNPDIHLRRIGVVNQTTMLAAETQQIADFLRTTIQEKATDSTESREELFADTRDTLCYATNDNQTAVSGLLQAPADLAIVIGGYNSSNTSHLVELCELKLTTYFVDSADKIISDKEILHFDLHGHVEKTSMNFLPQNTPVRILLTSGASCPDAVVEGVIKKLCELVPGTHGFGDMQAQFLIA